MSHEPSAKRQRVDDSNFLVRATPAVSLERIGDLRTKVMALPATTVQAIATVVATKEPSGLLARFIDEEHARLLEQERAQAAQPISFAKYVGRADYVLNKQYEHLTGADQFVAAGNAEAAVDAMLYDIVQETKDNSVYATKKSAVDTMRSIFEIMLDSSGVIGKEVRNDCGTWDSKFLQLMGRFSEEELERLATEDEGAWVEQFRALVNNANSYCVLQKLQESLEDLEAYQAGDEDDSQEDEENENENESESGNTGE